jgi:hypothetical protein
MYYEITMKYQYYKPDKLLWDYLMLAPTQSSMPTVPLSTSLQEIRQAGIYFHWHL